MGCAGPLRQVSEAGEILYEHRERGYRIRDAAAPEGSRWRRVEVDGADLAYSERSGEGRRGGSNMTLIAACRGPASDPMILARHLLIGIEPRTLRAAAPAVVDGAPAWSQTFDAEIDAIPVRVKTITAATHECSYDWVLVATHDFERIERDFDSWWLSFRLYSGSIVPETVVGLPGRGGGAGAGGEGEAVE